MCSALPLFAQIVMTNQTTSAGITFVHSTTAAPVVGALFSTSFAGGAAAEDFNNDGYLDLFVVQNDESQPCHLYINQQDGTFNEESPARGAQLFTFGSGASAADFDNDGDIDICVPNIAPNHTLLINDGQGSFTIENVGLDKPAAFTTSSSWGDVDNDGLLELAIAGWQSSGHQLALYRWGGDAFAEFEFRTDPTNDNLNVFSPRFADVTGDGIQDLPMVADHHFSQLYHNNGEGLFTNVTDLTDVGTDENGMGSAIGDYDNDGDLDWFVSSIADSITPGKIGNRLYQNDGNGIFADVTDTAGVSAGYWGWGASFGDLDLDGDLDLMHVNGYGRGVVDPTRLFENLGDGTFREVSTAAGVDDMGDGRGLLLADMDNDGDLDAFVSNNNEPPIYYRNDTATSNTWLKVTLDGTPPYHRNGIGSRVYVTTGDLMQMRELHASTNFMSMEPGRIAHFGLAEATSATQVRALWVSGDEVVQYNVAANQQISLPSPNAIISTRTPNVHEAILADAKAVAPLDSAKTWEHGGIIYSDPASIAFDSTEKQQLRLNIYDSATSELLRSEFYYVEPQAQPQSAYWMTY
jgi:hypothetical protein